MMGAIFRRAGGVSPLLSAQQGADAPRSPAVPWWAVLAWVALIVAVVVRVAVSSPASQSVVPIYLNAGRQWAEGENTFGYTPGLDMFRQPPIFAAAFVPLAPLPSKAVAIGWRLLGVGVFLLGLAGVVGIVRRVWPLAGWQLGLLWAVAAELIIPSFNNGQANLILIGAVLCGAAAAGRGRPWRAALWLTLAAWVKGYPLAAGLLVSLVAPAVGWRLLLLVAAVFLGSFLLQQPDYVWNQYLEFVHRARTEDRTYGPLDRMERDWRIVCRVWGGVIYSERMAAAVQVVVGAVFAGLTWVRARRSGRDRGLLTALSLGAVWMTLFGPATENPTYTLLAAATAVAVAAHTTRDRPVWAALVWAAYLLQLAPVVRGVFPTSDVVPLRTAQPIGAAVLLAVLVAEAVGERVRLGRAGGVSPLFVSQQGADAPRSPSN